MLHPDTETARQLIRERQAELKQDWRCEDRPDVVESRERRRHPRLNWLRAHLLPARHVW